jgi:hypothetical protein
MTQQPKGSGPDLIGDFQRWLVRSSARSVSREVSGHLRSVLGWEQGGDVWESATSPALDEAPECAWCPVCRAARVLRESGPGVTSQVAAASDALAGLVHDALSVVESALASAGRPAGSGAGAAGAPAGSGTGWDPAGRGVTWVETESASVWERAAAGSSPGPDAADPEDGPGPAGLPGGPLHEPDDRD